MKVEGKKKSVRYVVYGAFAGLFFFFFEKGTPWEKKFETKRSKQNKIILSENKKKKRKREF